MRSAGICSSDLAALAWGPKPYTLGHEIAGELEDGTLVAIDPLLGCRTCDRCLLDARNQCRNLASDACYGFGLDGGMADEITVDRSCIVRLPSGLDVADGALVEVIACGIHAAVHTGVAVGHRVAVIGCGAIGLGAVAAARAAGADVDVSARHDAQQRAAEILGAGLRFRGEYDVVVEAAGSTAAVAQALELVRPQGTVALISTYWDGVTLPGFNSKEVCWKEVRGYGRTAAGRELDGAATLLAHAPEVAEAIITHRFGLDDAPEAFRVAQERSQGAIKVVLHP